MNSYDFLTALGLVDQKLILEAVDLMQLNAAPQKRRTGQSRSRRARRTLLIAALIAVLFTVAAFALGYGAQLHKTQGLSGTIVGHSGNFGDVQTYITFDIEGECLTAQFKANWLPDREGSVDFTGYLAAKPEDNALPYLIQIYTGNRLKDVRCMFSGQTETVLQDEWLGMQRTELSVYGDSWGGRPANYLLLFQTEGNYLVYIAGNSDFSVLEKIAENMEFKTGDTDSFSRSKPTDAMWLDMALG